MQYTYKTLQYVSFVYQYFMDILYNSSISLKKNSCLIFYTLHYEHNLVLHFSLVDMLFPLFCQHNVAVNIHVHKFLHSPAFICFC